MSQSPTRYFHCSECGARCPDWEAYERRGMIYCAHCLLNTADKRAYEKWFVEPNS